MTEMRSTLSDDAGNDPYSRPQESSHIRTGARVVHAHSSNSRDIQRRRHVGNAASVSDGDDNPSSYHKKNVRNNSKYEKKDVRTRRQKGGRWNKMFLFIILPTVFCIVGFTWMLSSLHTSSHQRSRRDDAPAPAPADSPKLRAQVTIPEKRIQVGERIEKNQTIITDANNRAPRDGTFEIGTTLWKKFTEDNGKRKYYSGTIESYDPKEGLYKIVYEDGDEEVLTKKEVSKLLEKTKKMEDKAADVEKNLGVESELYVLNTRYDARQYVKSFDEKAKKAIADQVSKIHPKSIQLQGWNNPIAFRTFPLAKNILGPIKSVDPDYGEIAYESLRNSSKFSRSLPDDDDYIAPGGFDSNSIDTTKSLKTRYQRTRGNSTNNHPIGRTEKFDPKAEGLQPGKLRQFFDDDRVRITYAKGESGKNGDDDDESADENTGQTGACRAMEWEYSYYPTCNAFHEIDLARPFDDPLLLTKPRPENSMLKVTYINHGFYRDVFLVEDSPWLWPFEYKNEQSKRPTERYGVLDEDEVTERVAKAYRSAVLKIFNWDRPMDDENREMVNIEAVVMERLKKSPRIIDIYGHCGYSISAEVVPIEFEEVVIHKEGYASQEEVEEHHKNGLHPYNNFTVEEKLGFALSMAESIADLHGFSEGVIVHDDIQLCQWLRLPDGEMKLGDFNRATIMEYDVVNDKYCKFNNGNAFGNYRAPEEFAAKDLDEKIDVFSFGNNLYAMLTGLWGFYDIDDDESTQEALIDGKLPYIDPRWKERSYVERRLVELMEKCWAYNPDDRVDIFYAVEFLRETVSENDKLNRNNS